MSISVGIDLGTTFSAVAYIDPKSKSPQIIPNREGKKITPSVIQFLDGEIIFATRLYRKSKLKVGDVVVYYAPNEKRRIVIKRIAEIDTNVGVMYCLGDNADESYDSRVYGYVPLNRLICKPITQRKQKVR